MKQHIHFLMLGLFSATILSGLVQAAELQVPAFTAYLSPDVDGARVSSRSGITRWDDPALSVLWFGQIKTPGSLDCSVTLRLPEGATSRLRLTVAGQSREASVQGAGDDPTTARFGSFDIKEAGYQRFALESLNPQGRPFGDIDALLLDGPATQDAHFNLKPRRNAASVHLSYPVDRDTKVEAFYCEMTGLEDPLWTYYMACGWHRGYFGMQVNSPTERRIIFSVWDSGNEAVDRGKVADENRVRLVAKGEDVYAGDFGNEGTGGHSHLKYMWKTGEKQRFIVTARPTDATHTTYSGYYFHPDKKQWFLISSWSAPKEGGYMRGLYSFSENFGGANGHLLRKALYGNQWIRTAEGQWIELTTAGFSHDETGKADRLDRFMGVQDGQFFLSHGGFLPGFTEYRERFTRPAAGSAPSDFDEGGKVLRVLPTEDFVVNGRGDASTWSKTDWEPLHRRTADGHPYATRVKTLYSQTGLYVLMDAQDSRITATMNEDFLDLWNEDVFEFFLWPDERHPVYFEYEISPLGFELPILIPNFDGRFLGWRPWHYEGTRRTQKATTTIGGPKRSGASVTGWRAEVFVPYELLKPLQNVPPQPGTKWRANFYRVDYDEGKSTSWDWARVGPNFHEFQKFGTLLFE